MSDPDLFKYDVRVRQRLLDAGILTEEQVARHLDALPDAAQKADDLPMSQPAMLRAEGVGMRRRESGPAAAPWAPPEPPAAETSAAVDEVAEEEEEDDDEVEDEDDDDDGWDSPGPQAPDPTGGGESS